MERSLVRFAEDTKLEGVAFGTLGDRSPSAVHSELFRLEECTDRDNVKFKKCKCKDTWERIAPYNKKGWGLSAWGAALLEKTWSLADSKLSKN